MAGREALACGFPRLGAVWAGMTIKKSILKFIALVIVSIVAALLAMLADTKLLAKLDTMSASEVVEQQRKMYHHSFSHHFFLWLSVGVFFIVAVEFLAYVIGLFIKKPADKSL